METENWWAPLLRPAGIGATIESGKIVLTKDGQAQAHLAPKDARSFATHLILLAEQAAGETPSAPYDDGRPLEWRRDGCYIEDDWRPLLDGDGLYMREDFGWLRGLCITGAAVPLLRVSRGVMYVRPRAHPLGDPTLFSRVSES